MVCRRALLANRTWSLQGFLEFDKVQTIDHRFYGLSNLNRKLLYDEEVQDRRCEVAEPRFRAVCVDRNRFYWHFASSEDFPPLGLPSKLSDPAVASLLSINPLLS